VIAAGEVILNAFPVGADIEWLDFAIHAGRAQLREVVLAAFPSVIAFGLIVLFFGLSFATKRLRIASVALTISLVLFFLLPVAASFHTHIIAGRYWMIGAPAVTVFLLFFIRSWIDDVTRCAKGWPLKLSAVVATAAFVALVTVNGFGAARAFVGLKPAWRGGLLVAPMIRNCPPRSIHVLVLFRKVLGHAIYGYAFASKMPESTFLPVLRGEIFPGFENEGANAGPSIGVSCPVLGWAEHVSAEMIHLDIQTATDQELLSQLKIDVAPADVLILRQKKGYVVLRRNS
jgi:hypothetical protein